MGSATTRVHRPALTALVTAAMSLCLCLVLPGRAAEADVAADVAWLRSLTTRGESSQLEDGSLEQGIAGLGWLVMYPSWHLPELLIIRPDEVQIDRLCDQATFDSMLRNRRFLKVFAQLSALPRSEAGALLLRSLRAALADYTPRFQQKLEWYTQADRDRFRTTGSHMTFGRGWDTAEKVPTAVPGLPYRVLALVLVAGSLGIEEVKPVFDDVLSLALSQRRHFRETADLSLRARGFLLGDWSCYNRIVLATGLSAACGDLAKFRAACKKLGIEEVTRSLPAYDGSPAGRLTLRLYQVTDDAQFDALLKELDYAVREAPARAEAPAGADPVGGGQ